MRDGWGEAAFVTAGHGWGDKRVKSKPKKAQEC